MQWCVLMSAHCFLTDAVVCAGACTAGVFSLTQWCVLMPALIQTRKLGRHYCL